MSKQRVITEISMKSMMVLGEYWDAQLYILKSAFTNPKNIKDFDKLKDEFLFHAKVRRIKFVVINDFEDLLAENANDLVELDQLRSFKKKYEEFENFKKKEFNGYTSLKRKERELRKLKESVIRYFELINSNVANQEFLDLHQKLSNLVDND